MTGKRDINFIRHIRPQIKVREKADKQFSKWNEQDKIERELRARGIDPTPTLGLQEMGFLASLMRRIREGELSEEER